MLSDAMNKALNSQVKLELSSSYAYAAMAAYFHMENLDGFASWMTMQAQEELGHAQKLYKYIIDANGKIEFEAIDKPCVKFDSPLAVFEASLGHEQEVTKAINELMDTAAAEKDHATTVLLQWFVMEQVEEEANVEGIIQKLKLVGNTPNGLFMMDRALGDRQAAPASPTA